MTEPAPLRAEVSFAIIPEWVLFHGGLTGDDVRLYGVLARHADSKTRQCFPGQTLLAQEAHISERGVRNCVERLTSVGAVMVRRRWKDDRDRIFYESGKGRTQTSSEYVIRVSHPQGGVAAPDATTWRQELPPNERTTKNFRRQMVPPPLTRANADKIEQDRMALRGQFKTWVPPKNAIWSEELDGWAVDGALIPNQPGKAPTS